MDRLVSFGPAESLGPHRPVDGTLMKGVLGNDGTYIFLAYFNLPRDTSANCIFILSKTIFIISELPKKFGKIYFLFVKIKPSKNILFKYKL